MYERRDSMLDAANTSPDLQSIAGFVHHVDVAEIGSTWRSGPPMPLSYVFTTADLTPTTLVAVQRWAASLQMPRPRIISPFTVEWSATFHPRFFHAARLSWPNATLSPRLTLHPSIDWTASELTRWWLQSVLFLSTVTLSAAIIQSRWSPGMLGSKFDRLWQAADLAESGTIPGLPSAGLRDAVLALATEEMPDLERLLSLRRISERLIEGLSANADVDRRIMSATRLSEPLLSRFGFISDIQAIAGSDLKAVIVYGSSVNSDDFADYDLVLVTARPEQILRRLSGTSPTWAGRELNMGIYSPEEFFTMQCLSGDNLDGYGICIFGEIEIPHKDKVNLLMRNLSFGLVRLRQQLGMLSMLMCSADPLPAERRNLYDYFVKIPMNILRGTWGVGGEQASKQELAAWLTEHISFDVTRERRRAVQGDPTTALAAASVATVSVLNHLNQEFGIIVPSVEPGLTGSTCGIARDGSSSTGSA